MSKNAIALHGWVWSRNFGDLLMLDLARSWLEGVGAPKVIAPWAASVVEREIGLAASGPENIADAAALLVPGGGSFGLQPHSGWRGRVGMMRRMMLPLTKSRLKGSPYHIIGVGAGPFGGWLDGRVVAHVANNARRLTVRDEESADYLKAAGVRADRMEVTADLVLTLTNADIPDAAKTTATQLLSSFELGRPIVGIHLSGSPTSPDFAPSHEAVAMIARRHPLAQFALLIDHPAGQPGTLTEQMLAAQALEAMLGSRAKTLAYPGHWAMVALLGKLDVVLTNKLHVAIASLALGRPAIAVAKHPKNRRLYRQLGIPDWCFEIASARASDIAGLVSEVGLGSAPAHYCLSPQIRAIAGRNRTYIEEIVGAVRLSSVT